MSACVGPPMFGLSLQCSHSARAMTCRARAERGRSVIVRGPADVVDVQMAVHHDVDVLGA